MLAGIVGARAVGSLPATEQIQGGYGLVVLTPGATLKCTSALTYLEAVAAIIAELFPE